MWAFTAAFTIILVWIIEDNLSKSIAIHVLRWYINHLHVSLLSIFKKFTGVHRLFGNVMTY